MTRDGQVGNTGGMEMIDMESMAMTMPEVEGHPNREAFRGVLTLVDATSDRAPSGAKGHRVALTRGAAEQALPSLLGMALDYAPMFDRHDARRKVGVITRAEIVGRALEVGGHLFAKDFPEVVQEIQASGGRVGNQETGNKCQVPDPRELMARRADKGARSSLGMSFEVASVQVADIRASVWVLTQVTFTGAAVLRRDKAAYESTWIELGE